MILLDTHVLIWWVNGESGRISETAGQAILDARKDGEILLSSISAWEVAMLVDHGRLTLAEDVETWLTRVARIQSLRIVPIDSDIAVASALLPGEFHKDPADRMIVATARKLAIPIVTADARIRAYRQVRSIW